MRDEFEYEALNIFRSGGEPLDHYELANDMLRWYERGAAALIGLVGMAQAIANRE